MDKIEIIPSDAFHKAIERLSLDRDTPATITSYLKKDISSLTTSDIKWCYIALKKINYGIPISKLIYKSKIVLPANKNPERSMELQERLKKIKNQLDNKEYKEMTKNVTGDLKGYKAEFNMIGQDMKEINRQIVTGLQYIVSIIGTFFAIFIASGLVLNEFGSRIILGVFSAIAVGIAELYFVIQEDLSCEKKLEDKIK